MEIDKKLVMMAFENINLVELMMEKNLRLKSIIDVANDYFEKNNYSLRLSPSNYDSLQRIIKIHYGYRMIKGQKKTSNWEPTNEPIEPFKPELEDVKKSNTPRKEKTDEIKKLLESVEVSDDTILNCLKTIIKIGYGIHSDVRSLKSTPRSDGSYNNSQKDLIKTFLATYGTEMSTYKKVIITKRLDDQLSKIVFDRYEISKNDKDYFSKILALAMMLLSKPI